VLSPIGQLPPSVYWRRRLTLLGLVLVLSLGAGWFFLAGAAGDPGEEAADPTTEASSPEPAGGALVPGLEQIVPSLAPAGTAEPTTPPDGAAADPAAEPVEPVEPGPCPDEAIGLAVGSEFGTYAAGSKPLLGLNVSNLGAVPCFRELDAALQTWGLFAADGTRLWGSNDCFPEPSVSNIPLLQPGQVVTFTIIWSGRTSEPSCTVPRQTLGAGSYILRGYLGNLVSPDVPFVLT